METLQALNKCHGVINILKKGMSHSHDAFYTQMVDA